MKPGRLLEESATAEGQMADCIARFRGEPGVTDAPRICSWMRKERKGFFASAGPSEGEMSDVVDEWKRAENQRPMFDGEEADSSTAHGALMRPEESIKGIRPFRPMAEAVKIDHNKREIRCEIISEGLGNRRDLHDYGAVAVQDVARLLPGTRAFVNHAKESDEAERPEGNLWEQCGYWRDAVAELREGRMTCVGTLVLDKSPAGDEVLAKAEHALQMAREFPELKEHYAGVSINGDGETEPRKKTVDGEELDTNFVAHVTALSSADVVTRAARGGKFLSLVESVRNATGQEGVTIMNEALKKELERCAEAMKKLSEDEKTNPQAVFDMLTGSVKNVRTLAKSSGAPVAEADDDKEKEEAEDEDEEEAEDEDKKEEADEDDEKEEAEDDEDMEEEEDEDKDKVGEKCKTSKRESKKVRMLRKRLAGEKKARKTAESRSATHAASADIKVIKEAGLGDGMSDKDLASLPIAQRKMLVGIAKKLDESDGTGIGTTQRSHARGNGKGDPGKGFVESLNTRTGAR